MTKNQKLLLITGIGLIIVIIYIAIFIYPQISSILITNNQIYNEKTKLAELDMNENSLKKFKNKENELNIIFDQVSKHLISQEEILDLIVQLENIAQETNNEQEISIKEKETKPQVKKTEEEITQPEKEKQKNPLDELNSEIMQVNLKGDYNSLIKYLIELNRANILTDQIFLNISLQGLEQVQPNQPMTNEEAPAENLLTTILEIKAFYTK